MFDWGDYLELADRLRRDLQLTNLEEARYRTSVSRAYYAAFKLALNFAANDNPPYQPARTGQDHNLLQDFFRNPPSGASNPRIRRKIGTDLDRLRDNRNEADYDDVLGGPALPIAQSSIAIARNIIQNLQQL